MNTEKPEADDAAIERALSEKIEDAVVVYTAAPLCNEIAGRLNVPFDKVREVYRSEHIQNKNRKARRENLQYEFITFVDGGVSHVEAIRMLSEKYGISAQCARTGVTSEVIDEMRVKFYHRKIDEMKRLTGQGLSDKAASLIASDGSGISAAAILFHYKGRHKKGK